MTWNRRTFLQGTSLATLGQVIPARLSASERSRPIGLSPDHAPDPDALQRVIRQAVDAAQASGASYADARITRTHKLSVGDESHGFVQHIGIGVRSLVRGRWGFAASPICTDQEARRLGVAACDQARKLAGPVSAGSGLATPQGDVSKRANPPVTGEWTMPVQDDPFLIYPGEIQDYLKSLIMYMSTIPSISPKRPAASFEKQFKLFGSSTGDMVAQTLYQSSGAVGFELPVGRGRTITFMLDCLSPAGLGFEYFRGQDLRAKIIALYEEARTDVAFPVEPFDVGRYTILIDTLGVAGLIGSTIGAATELDRVIGDEANAGGTSYLNEPAAMLGSLKMGSASFRVTSQRSEPGGVATVKWDDEGIMPRETELVRDGILRGFQASSETGAAAGVGDGSSGVMHVVDGTFPPIIRSGNVTMHPGPEDIDTDSLLQEIDDGFFFKRSGHEMDFQLATGVISGWAFRVKRGKRVSRVPNAGVLFQTVQFWNTLQKIGGASAQRRLGMATFKGEPSTQSYFSATAVPAIFKDAAVVDLSRK